MKFKLIAVIVVAALLSQSCSNRKNTWNRRFYHEMTTKYNVNFNGYESLNDGLLAIEENHIDNFSEVIPVFPFDTSAISLVFPEMIRAQAKAQKAIERHSIRKKPVKKSIKYRTDPDYNAFYNQEEFNDQLDKSWMLLGEAQFYKGEFLRAIGTFKFIADKYQTNPQVNAEALIWKVRCYSELEWYIEAESLLKMINEDGFPEETTNWYSKIKTDLLIKERLYKQAVEPLQTTIKTEKVRADKLRYIFILAQIYQELKEPELAYETYSELLKKFPNSEMAINARIKRAEVMGTDQYDKMHRELVHLFKRHQEDKYTCRILYALGNISLGMQDTIQGGNYYLQSLDTKVKDDFYAGLSSLKLGLIYQNEQNYREASNYYVPAQDLLNKSYRDYKNVKTQAKKYSYFAKVYDAVALQDSLLYLASLDEEDRNKVIDQLVAQEKTRLLEAQNQDSSVETPTMDKPLVDNPSDKETDAKGAWYFYNPDVVAQGKMIFQKQWGDREMQDNWRVVSTMAQKVNTDNEVLVENKPQETGTDSITVDRSKFTKNIPLTDEDKEKSRAELERNLLSLAYSYQYDIKNFPLAIETFKRYEQEFSSSSQMGSVYYALYQLSDSTNNELEKTSYRNKLLDRYSNTRFGILLTDPNYIGRIAALDEQERKSYSNIYSSFLDDESSQVLSQSEQYKKEHEDSPMIPQVLYMEAISKGKQGNMTDFEQDLKTIGIKYNQSDIAPLANSVLAMFEQDSIKENVKMLPSGTQKGLLDEKDREILALQATEKAMNWTPAPEIMDEEFTYNPMETHFFGVWVDDTSNMANDLLYETARLNFTKFVNENYGMSKRQMKKSENIIVVGSFSDHQDGLAYGNQYLQDSIIQQMLPHTHYKTFTISEKNLRVLSSSKNTANYIWFYNKYYLGIDAEKPKPEVIEVPKLTDTLNINLDANREVKINDSLTYAVAPKVDTVAKATPKTPEQAKEETFGGIYVIETPSTDQYYGIACLSGTVNTDSLQAALDVFMQKYDPNMKVTIEVKTSDKLKLILIGSLGGKEDGLKFLYAIVKDAQIKQVLKSCDYRNALISKRNADLLLNSNNISLYSEYFKKLYLGR